MKQLLDKISRLRGTLSTTECFAYLINNPRYNYKYGRQLEERFSDWWTKEQTNSKFIKGDSLSTIKIPLQLFRNGYLNNFLKRFKESTYSLDFITLNLFHEDNGSYDITLTAKQQVSPRDEQKCSIFVECQTLEAVKSALETMFRDPDAIVYQMYLSNAQI